MKKHVIELEAEGLYHIFNRGIDGGTIFFSPKNYTYFLKLLNEKVGKIATIQCYCLMQNHFHLLVRIKSEEEIRKHFQEKESAEITKLISKQFSNAFNSYTQAINKSILRTGKLFELPFRRIRIENSAKYVNTILYIHCNPAKHKIEYDIFNYNNSSASHFLYGLDINPVIKELFETVENYSFLHNEYLKRYL